MFIKNLIFTALICATSSAISQSLLDKYDKATVRFEKISKQIEKLVTPPVGTVSEEVEEAFFKKQ